MSNIISLDELRVAFEEDRKKKYEEEPKGLIFRCRRSAWASSNGDINFRYQFRFLKSKSGEGEHVDWLWDEFQQRVDDYSFWGSYGVDFEDCEDGQLYEFKVTGVDRDWETGIVEDFDLGFVKVEEDPKTSG